MALLIIFSGLLILLMLALFPAKNKPALFAADLIVADAIILNVQLTGVCVKNELQAIVQLQVQPEWGKSFVTEVKEMITAAEYVKLQQGNKILVSYNSNNQKEMAIVKTSIAAVINIADKTYKI